MGIWGDDKDKNASVSEAVAAGIKEAMGPVIEGILKMSEDTLNTAMEAQKKSASEMAEAFLSALTKQTDAVYTDLLSNLNESVKLQRELNDTLKSEIAELKAIAEMQKETAVLSKEAADSLKAGAADVNNTLKTTAGEVAGILGENAKEMRAAAESTFSGIRDAQIKISNVYENMSDSATALVSREDKIVKNQKELLDEAAEKLLNLQKDWTENFTKCEQTLSGSYAAIFEKLDKTTESVKAYGSALDAATESLKTGVASYNESINSGIKETFAVMDGEAAKLAKTLTETGQQIADAAANIPKALRGLSV